MLSRVKSFFYFVFFVAIFPISAVFFVFIVNKAIKESRNDDNNRIYEKYMGNGSLY